MIARKEDYRYVTGDLESVIIDGGVMTARANPDVLRGEDICFIAEAALARKHFLNGYALSHAFTRVLSWAQVSAVTDSVRSLSGAPFLHPYPPLPSAATWYMDVLTGEREGYNYDSIYSFLSALVGWHTVDVPYPTSALRKEPILKALTALAQLTRVALPDGYGTAVVRLTSDSGFEYEENDWGYDPPEKPPHSSGPLVLAYSDMAIDFEGTRFQGYFHKLKTMLNGDGQHVESYQCRVAAPHVVSLAGCYARFDGKYEAQRPAHEPGEATIRNRVASSVVPLSATMANGLIQLPVSQILLAANDMRDNLLRVNLSLAHSHLYYEVSLREVYFIFSVNSDYIPPTI